jgi:hypothetical protein
MATPTSIVVGIPGPWHDLAELSSDIAAHSPGYALRASDLVHTADDQHYQLELMERDPHLRNTFALANPSSFTPADLALIDVHEQIAYLAGSGGSTKAACAMMHAAATLLQAGGFAVKVETSGAAHSARDWLMQSERCPDHVGALYIAYVALVSGKDAVYSCGMRNLGYPDAITSPTPNAGQALELLRGFLMGLLHDPLAEPLTVVSGQTTIGDGAGGRYRLDLESCQIYPPEDQFYNPSGMWRLTKL